MQTERLKRAAGARITGLLPADLNGGERPPKTNFSNASLIGKNWYIPAFSLSLDLFRINGFEGEKLLSAVPGAA